MAHYLKKVKIRKKHIAICTPSQPDRRYESCRGVDRDKKAELDSFISIDFGWTRAGLGIGLLLEAPDTLHLANSGMVTPKTP